MDSSEREMFRHQIELLEMQIQEQRKRQQVLRTLNDKLQQQLQAVAAEKDQFEQINQQLLERIKISKDRYAEEVRYSETEALRLKNQLNDKIKQCERNDVEAQRRELMYQEKISMLENIIEKKCSRVGDLQKKLHDQSICEFKDSSRISSQLPMSRVGGDLAVSAISYSRCDTENNMKYSNLSTSRQSKVGEFVKMDKSQLKVMMRALIKSKQQLEQGSYDVSMCGETMTRNKTFYS